MENDIAGDPMNEKKWSKKTTYTLKDDLKEEGIEISPNSVAKVLKFGKFSLRLNRKSIAETKHPDRNEQFGIIASEKESFRKMGQAIICVDSKKKELIGNFKNPGKRWTLTVDEVLNHDFRSQAIGLANPYGIYEPVYNQGTVIVGTSRDTGEFAVDAIKSWIETYALKKYKDFKRLLILGDSGGSNGARPRLWKYSLFHKIAKPYGISIKVCHFPAGASKWNPVDHRLFSFISLNRQGVPLRSYDIALGYIRSTTTRKGLEVEAMLNQNEYKKGISITDEQMKEINLVRGKRLPQWNYEIAA